MKIPNVWFVVSKCVPNITLFEIGDVVKPFRYDSETERYFVGHVGSGKSGVAWLPTNALTLYDDQVQAQGATDGC